jgi:hypothetical protein
LGYLNDSLQIKFSEPVFCSVTDVIWKKLLGPRHAKYAFRFGMGLTFGHADLSLTWNDLTYQLTLPARYLPFRRIFADMGAHMFFLYQPTVVDMFGHVWICFYVRNPKHSHWFGKKLQFSRRLLPRFVPTRLPRPAAKGVAWHHDNIEHRDTDYHIDRE